MIPENEYIKRCQLSSAGIVSSILNTNLFDHQKVNLVNNSIIQEMNKRDQLQSRYLISPTSSNELYDKQTNMNIEKAGKERAHKTENKIREKEGDISTASVSQVLDFDGSFYETPDKNRFIIKHNIVGTSVQRTQADDLELALSNIPSLVSNDGKILRKDGTEIQNSNLRRIVNFLCLFKNFQKNDNTARYRKSY